MEPIPPRIEDVPRISRGRWWIHLALITGYILLIAVLGAVRNKSTHPALTHTASGLLIVSGAEVLLFGIVFGLAWLASRATRDELLLRWRGAATPVLLGAGYSLALRIGVGAISALISAILLVTRVMTPDSLGDFALKNRPGVENLVDVDALRGNSAYFWLTITVVSFVVAGLREELWRSSFLAGLKALWPRPFGSRLGQSAAVVIAAVIFGLAHVSMGPLAMLMAGFLGLGLGFIMVFHRSIWPAVIAHGFFDATTMALIPWAVGMMKHLPAHSP
ncbi:MAG TPA: type II CAAX endopeptidase family protein [Verrucomicrobiae bacterium]|jgi:membrane protease YdiL (CAAX protease family)